MVKSKKTSDVQIQRMTSEQLQQKVQEFLSSRKKANNIVDIMSTWDESSPDCILALETIFTEVLKRGDMYLEEKSLNLTPSEKKRNIEAEYTKWLKSRYEEVWEKLLSIIESGKLLLSIKQQALATCFKLMSEEGKLPIESTEKVNYYFPIHRLKSILQKLLSPDHDNTELISKFQEISCYKDALYFTWLNFLQLTPKDGKNDILSNNLLEIIDKIPLPSAKGKNKFTEENKGLLCGSKIDCNIFDWDEIKLEKIKEIVKKVWNRIMKWEKSSQINKKSLIILLDRVMPNLDKPLYLTDYLWNLIDIDGPIGLLALQGISILVTEHNIEYSKIYDKLYSMLTPELFNSKFKVRLLHLCDVFFLSKYVSESLAAAFVKKFSRLTVVVSPEDIITILRFICNLILRHRGLEKLIDHPSGKDVIVDDKFTGDPFLMEESNPLLSNAQSSSLWEIKTLENHILPSVATAARFIRITLPSVEYDLSQTWDKTSGHIFKRETKRKTGDVVQTFKRPKSMALPSGEQLLEFWQL